MEQKFRRIVSYENMKEELAEVFNEKYPRGFSDYLPDIKEYQKPNGEYFYAVTVETEDSIYLVKVQVKTDDAEDIKRWLDNDDTDGDDEGDDGNDALPDDNISQYTTSDDDSVDAD